MARGPFAYQTTWELHDERCVHLLGRASAIVPAPGFQIGRNDCADVLEKNLEEEKVADKKLTEIALPSVNLKAA